MTDMTDDDFRKFYGDELRWCACADPGSAIRFMGDVLGKLAARSAAEYGEASNAALDEILGDLDCPLRLSYMYMLDAHDLTEHGGQVYGSWLAEKGEALLAYLAGKDEDDIDGILNPR